MLFLVNLVFFVFFVFFVLFVGSFICVYLHLSAVKFVFDS